MRNEVCGRDEGGWRDEKGWRDKEGWRGEEGWREEVKKVARSVSGNASRGEGGRGGYSKKRTKYPKNS